MYVVNCFPLIITLTVHNRNKNNKTNQPWKRFLWIIYNDEKSTLNELLKKKIMSQFIFNSYFQIPQNRQNRKKLQKKSWFLSLVKSVIKCREIWVPCAQNVRKFCRLRQNKLNHFYEIKTKIKNWNLKYPSCHLCNVYLQHILFIWVKGNYEKTRFLWWIFLPNITKLITCLN